MFDASKRIGLWILIPILALLLLAPIRGNAADTLSEGLFTYTVTGGEATITGHTSDLSGDITIPSTIGGYPVTSIGLRAFYNCRDITGVEIPDSVKTIGQSAFYYCEGLTNISIPDGVTTINAYAFECCSGLTNISIPDSVITLGNGVFSSCSKLQYNIYDEGKYLGNDGNPFHVLVAPASKSITSIEISKDTAVIAHEAFSGCIKLTAVSIPDHVTTIGGSAFEQCSSLTDVTIGNGVTSIGYYAFYKCGSLRALVIPDSVVTIAYGAFEDCTALADLTIGSNVKDIGNYAFSRSGIETIVIPGSVQSMGTRVFSNCTSLRSAVISNGLRTIGYQTFSGCTNLQEISIPESVTSIGESAFAGCGLQELYIPDSVTSVSKNAFSGCKNLQSLRISRNLTTIPDDVFLNCSNLYTVTISDTTTSVYNYAFRNCSVKKLVVEDGSVSLTASMLAFSSTLEEIVIPDSVTVIYDKTISECKNLKKIQVAENNASYCNGASGELLNKDRTELLFAPKDLTGSYCVSDGITTIGAMAFYNCALLTEITVSDQLTTVAGDAFSGCSIKKVIVADGASAITSAMIASEGTLEEVVIPESVTVFGDGAFSGCEKLKAIEVSQKVTSIGDNAFNGCKSLVSLVIPSSVAELGEGCFAGCTSLESLEIPFARTQITGVNNRVWKYPFGYFFGTDSEEGCVEVKQTVHMTPSGAYAPSAETRTYYIPESLQSVTVTADTIYEDTFGNCTMLKEINLPNVYTIEDYAFYGCSNLTTARVSDRLNSIGNYAFTSCSNLQYNVYDNAKYIGSANNPYVLLLDAVSDSVTSCAIHPATKLFAGRAFAGCSIQRLIYPKGFETITGDFVLTQTSLTEVVIANTVKTIESQAFSGSYYLKDVYYTGTQAEWADITIGSSNSPLQAATIHYNACFVTFKDWDGAVLAEQWMQVGDTLLLDTAPTRPADNTYTYTFAGWDSDVCTGDMEVTAIYTPQYIDYTVAFLNWDGSTLQSGTFHYGDAVTAPATPARPYDDGYYYVFAGWDGAVSALCDGNKTYTATYEAQKRTVPVNPSAPTAEQVTQSTVVLKPTDGYVYSLNGVTWQQSNVFTGLKASTEYHFYQMVPESETTIASQVSPALTVKTPDKIANTAKPADPIVADYAYDYVVLLARDGYEYRMNNGAWTADPSFTGLQADTTYVFYQRMAESDEAYAGAVSQPLTFTTAQQPTGMTSASAYERLRQYVIANGSGGILKKTQYINGGENRYYQLSAKNADGLVFSVEITSSSSTRTEISALFTLYPDDRYITVSVVVGDYDNGMVRDTAQAFIVVDRATYRASTRLTTNESGFSYITASELSDYATYAMTQLCGYWDLFLAMDSGLDMGMNALGFVNFVGYGQKTCDPVSGHHIGETQLRNQRQPSCSYDGYTGDYYCIGCGRKVTEGSVIPSDGSHSFTNYVSNHDVTCTANGTKTAKCDFCDEKDTQPETALGHSFTNYISNHDATYTADGTKTAKCDRCEVTDTVTDPGTMLQKSKNGWVSENSKWYFYENDKMVKNAWRKDSKGWCFLGADGAMLTNQWKKDSKGWCYIGSSGYIVYSKWVKDSIGWCYVDASGYMVYNKWVKDSVGWCHVGANGYMEYNKWIKDSKGWCHVGSSGYMEYNKWVKDSVGWCYVDASGYMVYNKWVKDSIGWCYVGADGYMVYNKWVKDSVGWCFVDSSGYMVTDSWERDSNGWNYINASGYLSAHKLDYHNHSFAPAKPGGRATCSCGAQRGKVKAQDPNCWSGTDVKHIMAVTGVTGIASYTSWTDLKPVSESYVAGCQRYSIDFDKEYTPYAPEEYEKYFAPYIAYLKSLGLECTSEPAAALGGFADETYQFKVNGMILSVSWNVSQYSNRSWIAIMLK